MKKICFVLLVISVLSFGCAGPGMIVTSDTGGNNLIWASAGERPSWTLEEAEISDDRFLAVGYGESKEAEAVARDAALQNVEKVALRFLDTYTENVLDDALIKEKLTLNVLNGSAAAKKFNRLLPNTVIPALEVSEWYVEKWKIPAGGYSWKVFTLHTTAVEKINRAFREFVKRELQNNRDEAQRAAGEKEKQHALARLAFWEKMEQRGLVKE